MVVRKCFTPGCENQRAKKPGNNMLYYRDCIEHTIERYKEKKEAIDNKNAIALDKMAKTGKKTPVQKFYASSAWRNCSHYVLLHYSDDNLMVRCSTSPHLEYHVTDKAIHCGHYHKANEHKAVAFEFKNLCPQSLTDNVYHSGKPEQMAEWIEETHGEGTLEWLDIEKNKTLKLDKYELERISKYYLNLLNEELKRRNIKNPWR